MTSLIWDAVGERRFETGVDRGVLYVSDAAVPWNGLRSVEEKFTDSGRPYYMDGIKYLDAEIPGDFAVTLKAITYPDEFEEFDGVGDAGGGLFVHDQPRRKRFDLAYRTRIGDDVEGTDRGYQIHILYNVVAVSDTSTFTSLSDRPSLTEFAWTLMGTPASHSGVKPTVHVILDSTEMSVFLLERLEDMLYGTEETDAHLPSLTELVTFVSGFEVIDIVDNGDGTWTATGPDSLITMIGDGIFQIDEANATYLDSDTYDISDTV